MTSSEISIPVGPDDSVSGSLVIPRGARGLVIFSHGSGSSRFSPRNRHVAAVLNNGRFATLLADLLTEEEDREYMNRFDIELLTTRLMAVTEYAKELPVLNELPAGYFGASTGAASALKAAAQLNHLIGAIVSRGGRPDLAGDALPDVEAPTLLIVGGRDTEVIALNKAAFRRLSCEKEMLIVPGATHLFEEPGTLDEVARLASEWFGKHLVEKATFHY